jgi:hypothetical protein
VREALVRLQAEAQGHAQPSLETSFQGT